MYCKCKWLSTIRWWQHYFVHVLLCLHVVCQSVLLKVSCNASKYSQTYIFASVTVIASGFSISHKKKYLDRLFLTDFKEIQCVLKCIFSVKFSMTKKLNQAERYRPWHQHTDTCWSDSLTVSTAKEEMPVNSHLLHLIAPFQGRHNRPSASALPVRVIIVLDFTLQHIFSLFLLFSL